MSKHILVVDDEARIREVVQYALAREGYQVSIATDGRAAIERVRAGGIDLLVLDVMLPEIDGLEVCRTIRRESTAPVLFLSARSEEVDRIVGLEIGGDDYLVKPFSPRELVARVRAVFRRIESVAAVAAAPSNSSAPVASPVAPAAVEKRANVLSHAGVEIDSERHEVRYSGQIIALTPTEFGVLSTLIERPGVVFSRGQLMQRAYSYDNLITERTIDTHVRRIRAKFRAAGGDPITTVHGIGYKA